MFKLTVTPEEIEKLDLASFPGQIHVISRPGWDFSRAIAYLKKQKVLGFDTETKPVFSPGQHHNGVALLQLSGPEHAFLFRIQKLGMRGRICSILSNPNIIKVGAAALDDVRGLQRYREFEPRGFLDLQKMVWEWGIRDKSVKKMAANILGVRISKSQQLSNLPETAEQREAPSETRGDAAAGAAAACLTRPGGGGTQTQGKRGKDSRGKVKTGGSAQTQILP